MVKKKTSHVHLLGYLILSLRVPLIGGDHGTNPGFGTPCIGHTPVSFVVNNIFFRYRQNIFS